MSYSTWDIVVKGVGVTHTHWLHHADTHLSALHAHTHTHTELMVSSPFSCRELLHVYANGWNKYTGYNFIHTYIGRTNRVLPYDLIVTFFIGNVFVYIYIYIYTCTK